MRQLNIRTIFYFVMATLLWAGNAIAGRLLVVSVSPIISSMLRWVVAVLILLPLGWRVFKPRSALWENKKRFALLGLLGVGSYNVLLYLALKTSTPINVTLIGASMPIWMLLVGSIFYKVHPTFLQLFGALISLFGVTVVLSRGDFSALFSMQLVLGDLFVVLATILWAFYSWMLSYPGKSSERTWPWEDFLMAQIFFGLIWTILFSGFEVSVGHAYIEMNTQVVFLILFGAIGPSLIAYRCWGLGVNDAGPTIAAFFANLIPVFTALMSALMLGESPSGFHGVAFLLIVVGIVISSRLKM